MEEVKEEKEKMNKDWRHGIFIVSGFTTMLVGPQLLGWTILQSIQVLALFGIVMNKLVNNRFCDWLDNHTSITRVVIKMFIIYNAFWIGVLIGRYIL